MSNNLLDGIACITHITGKGLTFSRSEQFDTSFLTPPSNDGVYTTDGSPPIGTYKWKKPIAPDGKMHITYAAALPKDGQLADIPHSHNVAIAINMAFTIIEQQCNLRFDKVPFTGPNCADITIVFDDGTDPIFVQIPSAMWYTRFPGTTPQGKFTSVANLKYLYALQDGPNFASDINQTMRHEFGHGIGMVHTTSSQDMMYPFYHEQRLYSSMDIYQMQIMYGPRIPPTNPIELAGLYNLDSRNLEFVL